MEVAEVAAYKHPCLAFRSSGVRCRLLTAFFLCDSYAIWARAPNGQTHEESNKAAPRPTPNKAAPTADTMPDPPELMRAAIAQRDKGNVLDPSMRDYDGGLTRTWGGPPPKWFSQAMAEYPRRFSVAAGRTALITGGSGGIGSDQMG